MSHCSQHQASWQCPGSQQDQAGWLLHQTAEDLLHKHLLSEILLGSYSGLLVALLLWHENYQLTPFKSATAFYTSAKQFQNPLQMLKFKAIFAILLHHGEAPSGALHPALGSSESSGAAGPSPEETMEMLPGLTPLLQRQAGRTGGVLLEKGLGTPYCRLSVPNGGGILDTDFF